MLRRFGARVLIVVVALIVIGWCVDQYPTPCLVRPSQEPRGTKRHSYIHRTGDHYWMSPCEAGSIGQARFVSVSQSIDHKWLNTEVLHWRHFVVIIGGKQLTGDSLDDWRLRSAVHWTTPEVLLSEKDETRRYVLGYPFEWIAALLLSAAGIAIPSFIVYVVAAVAHEIATQRPQTRRARLLARGECPRCRYSLQGLTVCRCPECGERWTENERLAACTPFDPLHGV